MDEEELKNQDPNADKGNLTEESLLLKEYKKLQENSVSKEKYEADTKALKEKADLYLKAITEGGKVDTDSEKDSGSIKDTISDLSKFKGTNLDYWKKTTKAIDQTIKALGSETIAKTIGNDGLEELIEVKENMQKMVDDSKDDPDYFRTLYNARVKDSAPRISSDIERSGGLVDYFSKKQK